MTDVVLAHAARNGGTVERYEAFVQTWPTSALGFGGGGMEMFTDAQTTIVYLSGEGDAGVYFDGRFAYAAPRELADQWVARQSAPSLIERLQGN